MEPLSVRSELLKDRIAESNTSILQVGQAINVEGDALSHNSVSIVDDLNWTFSNVSLRLFLNSYLGLRYVHPEKLVDKKIVISFLELKFLPLLYIIRNAEDLLQWKVFCGLGLLTRRYLSCHFISNYCFTRSNLFILFIKMTFVCVLLFRELRRPHSFSPCEITRPIDTKQNPWVNFFLFTELSPASLSSLLTLFILTVFILTFTISLVPSLFDYLILNFFTRFFLGFLLLKLRGLRNSYLIGAYICWRNLFLIFLLLFDSLTLFAVETWLEGNDHIIFFLIFLFGTQIFQIIIRWIFLKGHFVDWLLNIWILIVRSLNIMPIWFIFTDGLLLFLGWNRLLNFFDFFFLSYLFGCLYFLWLGNLFYDFYLLFWSLSCGFDYSF